AFGRYVSPEVAQQLLESPEGLRFGGEKRVGTVLMSDLRGYTRFAEQGDPARGMDVLNKYLARMTDIIVQHGGPLTAFIADGGVARVRRASRASGARGARRRLRARHAARHVRAESGARPRGTAALRDGDRSQHRRGGGGQHRL